MSAELVARLERWARLLHHEPVASVLGQAASCIEDQDGELRRHHADFERCERMAARGAAHVEANARMRTLLHEALYGPVPEDWAHRAALEVHTWSASTSSSVPPASGATAASAGASAVDASAPTDPGS